MKNIELDTALALPPLSDELIFVGTTASSEETSNEPPRSIEFQPLNIIGEGGSGIVYRALQRYPSRIVALKVCKAFASPRSALRFEREISILARLHHRGIAQLYSVGQINQGLKGTAPFIAMEFIDGQPITNYADRKQLSPQARIRLLLQVCEAIIYAHQNQIIHRDLKPENILVDTEGFPKVLDFGLASARDSLAAENQVTMHGDAMGTIDYVSPEQANGRAVDERTDVYSLGIILYQLLTGSLPFKLRGSSWVDAIATVSKIDPKAPSELHRSCRGDLDVIILKAISKDIQLRYPSVAALADDLERFLASKPIKAVPPTPLYRAKKYLRRHRYLLGITFSLLVTLSIGLILAINQANRANREAQHANQQTQLAEAQLSESLLAQGDAITEPDRITEARNLYQKAWATAETAHISSLPVEAAMWELDSRAFVPLQLLSSSKELVSNAVYSRSQQKIALDLQDRRVDLLDLVTNTRQTLSPDQAITMMLSPDGRYLALGFSTKFELWDLASTTRIATRSTSNALRLLSINNSCSLIEADGKFEYIPFSDHTVITQWNLPPSRFAQLTTKGIVLIDSQNKVYTGTNGNPDLTFAGSLPSFIEAAINPSTRCIAIQTGTTCHFFTCNPALQEIGSFTTTDFQLLSNFVSDNSVLLNNSRTAMSEVVTIQGLHENRFPSTGSGPHACYSDASISNTPDNTCILSIRADSRTIKKLSPPERKILAQAVSADGGLSAAAFEDGTVSIFDNLSGQSLTSFITLPSARTMAFSNDSLSLAISTNDTIQIWNVPSTTLATTLHSPEKIYSLFVRAEGHTVIIKTTNCHIFRYQDHDGKWSIEPIDSAILAVTCDVSLDGNHLCLAEVTKTELWDIQNKLLLTHAFQTPGPLSGPVICFSGNLIFAPSRTGQVYAWDTDGNDLGFTPGGFIKSCRAQGSPSNLTVFSDSRSIQLWDASTRATARTFNCPNKGVAESAYAPTILVHSITDGLVVWNFAVPQALRGAQTTLDSSSLISVDSRAHAYALAGLYNLAGRIYEQTPRQSPPSPLTLDDAYAFAAVNDTKMAVECLNQLPTLTPGSRQLLSQCLISETH